MSEQAAKTIFSSKAQGVSGDMAEALAACEKRVKLHLEQQTYASTPEEIARLKVLCAQDWDLHARLTALQSRGVTGWVAFAAEGEVDGFFGQKR